MMTQNHLDLFFIFVSARPILLDATNFKLIFYYSYKAIEKKYLIFGTMVLGLDPNPTP